jgi:enamine deaminase RidA (YjgF/YER057c/UK114 family)
VISGQVGIAADGSVPADTRGQIERAWDNLFAVLAAADMAVTDLVRIGTYLTEADAVPLWREIRDRRLGGHAPAATLVIVAALAAPQWRVEIEAVAAAAMES